MIHREVVDGEECLYWYSIHGEGGTTVSESSHEVDKKYLTSLEKYLTY